MRLPVDDVGDDLKSVAMRRKFMLAELAGRKIPFSVFYEEVGGFFHNATMMFVEFAEEHQGIFMECLADASKRLASYKARKLQPFPRILSLSRN